MAAADGAAFPSRGRSIRRRRQDKPAISARLILDDHIKGDVGIASEDVIADLLPHLRGSMCAPLQVASSLAHPESF